MPEVQVVLLLGERTLRGAEVGTGLRHASHGRSGCRWQRWRRRCSTGTHGLRQELLIGAGLEHRPRAEALALEYLARGAGVYRRIEQRLIAADAERSTPLRSHAAQHVDLPEAVAVVAGGCVVVVRVAAAARFGHGDRRHDRRIAVVEAGRQRQRLQLAGVQLAAANRARHQPVRSERTTGTTCTAERGSSLGRALLHLLRQLLACVLQDVADLARVALLQLADALGHADLELLQPTLQIGLSIDGAALVLNPLLVIAAEDLLYVFGGFDPFRGQASSPQPLPLGLKRFILQRLLQLGARVGDLPLDLQPLITEIALELHRALDRLALEVGDLLSIALRRIRQLLLCVLADLQLVLQRLLARTLSGSLTLAGSGLTRLALVGCRVVAH